MHERDLRRLALESGKTVSRKARSRQLSATSSKANSPAQSRAASRNTSRQPSDEEDSVLSDDTGWSVASREDAFALDDVESPSDVWEDELSIIIDTIITRKRQSGEKTSVEAREEALHRYVNFLRAKYAKDIVDTRIDELLPAIMKNVRSGESENEVLAALEAVGVTLITSPSDALYESLYELLKRTVVDSECIPVKASAIHALATATFYGGASEEEIEEVMAYLLEIIESDGYLVEAHDQGEVVTAALEEWGFLATKLPDLEEISLDAAEAFVDQLDSRGTRVQIAAGDNIALLYEQSHSLQDEGEDVDSDDEIPWEDDAPDFDPEYKPSDRLVRRYHVYRHEDQLRHVLKQLAKTSEKSINKSDRKSLRSNFSSILQTVESPRRGPGYRQTISKFTGMWHGYSLSVSVRGEGEMRIDRWWKLHRLRALRRILRGGFISHYEDNEVVFNTLPIIVQPVQATTDSIPDKAFRRMRLRE